MTLANEQVGLPSETPPDARDRSLLTMCVLGSGSGGNSSVVRFADTFMLIDAGFGPVTTVRRLAAAGMRLENIQAVLTTHLDQDHFRPQWIQTLRDWRIRLFVHRWHLRDLLRLDGAEQLQNAGLIESFGCESFQPLPHVSVQPIALPHDGKGTIGFLVETSAGRIGYATDLGHAPRQMIERFAGTDLLAIESNYDPGMQRRSRRPGFVKRRVMGERGHLSNREAFEAVRQIAIRSPRERPQHIVLLHRSRQCNDPQLVRKQFAQDPDIAGRIHLTEQRHCSCWFAIQPLRRRAQN